MEKTMRRLELRDNPNYCATVVKIENLHPLTQARKNGFSGEIPFGFTDRFVGKLKTRITILNWK